MEEPIMANRALLGAIVAAVAAPAFAAEEAFVIDPVHSQPYFEARHIGTLQPWRLSPQTETGLATG